MRYKLEFAGTKLHEIVQISRVNMSVLPPRQNFTRSTTSYNGSIFAGFKYGEKIISVDIGMPAKTRANYNEIVSKLSYALDVSSPSKLIINDSKIVYYAVVDGTTDVSKFFHSGTTTINFICHDPLGYEDEWSGSYVDNRTNMVTFKNMGTYSSYPVFGFNFKNPSTFLYITNDKSESVLIGSPKDETIETVVQNPNIVDDNCEDSSTFTNGGNTTVSDNRVVSGNYGVGNIGQSIVATSYGADTTGKWTGPTFRKNLGKNLEQFEVRVNVSFSSQGQNFTAPDPKDLVRVVRKSGTYLRDADGENANILKLIPYGTDLNMIKMGASRFCYLNYDGRNGWVDTNDLGRIKLNTYSNKSARATNADEQMGLIEAIGYDASGQLLFRFHIRDNNKYFEHVIPEVYIRDRIYLQSYTTTPTPNRVTEKDEQGKPIGETDIPSGAYGAWNDFTGTFAIRRKKLENGQYRWWARISRTEDGTYVEQEIHMGSGIVDDNLPKGQLNHIIFYIAKYDGAKPVSMMSVNHVKVVDISNEDGNQQEEVNYEIFKKGDFLEVDFEKCTVKLNNENFIHKLDIGSQFFTVGENSTVSIKSDDPDLLSSYSYRKRYI